MLFIAFVSWLSQDIQAEPTRPTRFLGAASLASPFRTITLASYKRKLIKLLVHLRLIWLLLKYGTLMGKIPNIPKRGQLAKYAITRTCEIPPESRIYCILRWLQRLRSPSSRKECRPTAAKFCQRTSFFPFVKYCLMYDFLSGGAYSIKGGAPGIVRRRSGRQAY